MAKRQKAGKGTVIAMERERKAVALRISGATYQAIADELGMTRDGAYKAVMRALEKSANETAKSSGQLREIEVKRLDAMVTALWPKVELGDVKAVATMLKVMSRRAALLGLDAPKQQQLDANVSLGTQSMDFGAVGVVKF